MYEYFLSYVAIIMNNIEKYLMVKHLSLISAANIAFGSIDFV